VTREKAQVLLALSALFVAVVACKHTYTPPGTTLDASADAIEERDPAPTGSCKPETGNTRCAAGDQAVFCKSRLVHDGPKSTHWEGDWTAFKCPDCKKTSQYAHIECSDYAAGDPCDSFVADEMCTRDKLAVYRCDHDTSTWKIEACPGGCSAVTATRSVQCK
jgi:hypothetical protein